LPEAEDSLDLILEPLSIISELVFIKQGMIFLKFISAQEKHKEIASYICRVTFANSPTNSDSPFSTVYSEPVLCTTGHITSGAVVLEIANILENGR